MSTASEAALRAARALVPAPLRARLRSLRERWALRRALRACARSLARGEAPGEALLEELLSAWGNPIWSADVPYLRAIVEEGMSTRGPILECGSGLTTLLLGLIARQRGLSLVALEHLPAWRDRVARELSALGLPASAARVVQAELRSRGDHAWYDLELATLPPRFRLVICDGPPATTPGGRYGLLPALGSKLDAGAIILLHDADRAGEQEVMARWKGEAGVEEIRSRRGARFAVLAAPGPIAR